VQIAYSLAGRLITCAVISTAVCGVASAQTDKTQAELHFKAGRIALQNNDMEGAEAELRLAMTFDPTNPVLVFNLAVTLVDRSPQEASDFLDKAIALGLPEAEQMKADELRPQIVYSVGKRMRSFQGIWQENTAHGGVGGQLHKWTQSKTWTIPRTASPTDGALKGDMSEGFVMVNTDGSPWGCTGQDEHGRIQQSFDVHIEGTVTVLLGTNPIKIIEARVRERKSCESTWPQWHGTSLSTHEYQMLSQTLEEMRVEELFRGKPSGITSTFKKQQ